MNRKRKIWLRSLLILLPAVFLLIHFYTPRFVVEIKNPLVLMVKPEFDHKAGREFEENGIAGKRIEIESPDGLKLRGFLARAQADSARGTLILLHGIRNRKEYFIPIMQKLTTAGFNAVALDHRAHGESDGQYCTFGVKEKADVSALIDYLFEKEELNGPIGVWGHSLGAAIGLQAMGEDPRIRFGIIESTFSDYRTIAHQYGKRYTGLDLGFLADYQISRAAEIAGFDPEVARPKASCEKITQPIRMVHGTADRNIDIRFGRENFEHLASKDKQFIEIEEADHNDVWKVAGDAYLDAMIQFAREQAAAQIN